NGADQAYGREFSVLPLAHMSIEHAADFAERAINAGDGCAKVLAFGRCRGLRWKDGRRLRDDRSGVPGLAFDNHGASCGGDPTTAASAMRMCSWRCSKFTPPMTRLVTPGVCRTKPIASLGSSRPWPSPFFTTTPTPAAAASPRIAACDGSSRLYSTI